MSHHGNFVCIASNPLYLVNLFAIIIEISILIFPKIGVDIVDIATRSPGINSSMEFVAMFNQQLTCFELNQIKRYNTLIICNAYTLIAEFYRQQSEIAKYNMFFLFWSLKESFIKAIGLGLGYNLREVKIL